MFYFGHFWGMHFIWWFLWSLFFVFLFAYRGRRRGWRYQQESPLDILMKRFASGEITIEEYEEPKKILERDRK